MHSDVHSMIHFSTTLWCVDPIERGGNRDECSMVMKPVEIEMNVLW